MEYKNAGYYLLLIKKVKKTINIGQGIYQRPEVNNYLIDTKACQAQIVLKCLY